MRGLTVLRNGEVQRRGIDKNRFRGISQRTKILVKLKEEVERNQFLVIYTIQENMFIETNQNHKLEHQKLLNMYPQ